MLTEEMLGALLDGVRVERLILVGDPRQLPPIGSGRPFVDIVSRLAPDDVETTFPRVGMSYAELTVRRRQREDSAIAGDQELDDLLLADWFSGEAPDAGADEIWDRLAANRDLQRIKLVNWKNSDDLRERLFQVLADELKLTGPDDEQGFEMSIGGRQYGEYVYFNRGKTQELVDSWQILSPVRGQAHGMVDLNRLIQRQFRKRTRQLATGRYRKTTKPVGTEEILYGDKVISTQNKRKKDVWPRDGALEYVANGEIGVIVGQFKGPNAKYKGLPWKLEVEFSSQPNYAYDYTTAGFSDEGDAPLELAYAITVHRAQGSEFGTTILVLPEVCRPLSRELLYTALTRQRDHIVILHQGDITRLRDLAEPRQSETARRLTNLFRPPAPVQLADRFLEGNLIHRTLGGELVRSKSEVIIANLLRSKGVEYLYERRLVNPSDGSFRYPDFTVEDLATGRTFYWEHLGMLKDAGYRARWKRKLAWYAEQGILDVEQGGGPGGALIVTRDDDETGIDSAALERIVDEVVLA
jgi:ATP-dependent exoDNAse (exonuclease V) alpha subunit